MLYSFIFFGYQNNDLFPSRSENHKSVFWFLLSPLDLRMRTNKPLALTRHKRLVMAVCFARPHNQSPHALIGEVQCPHSVWLSKYICTYLRIFECSEREIGGGPKRFDSSSNKWKGIGTVAEKKGVGELHGGPVELTHFQIIPKMFLKLF